MTTHNQFFPSGPLAAGEPAAPLSSWIKSISLWLVAWANACADHWAAASMYEQLSALSDAELTRRGLSRANLAHDVRAASDRGFEP